MSDAILNGRRRFKTHGEIMMSNKSALIIGGIGGSLPILINLINTNAATLFQGFDPLIFAGYTVKAILLIMLGILFVWINAETDMKKALQIGIMAPAMVVGYINGNSLKGAEEALGVAKQDLQNQQIEEKTTPPPATSNTSSIKYEKTFQLFSTAHAENGDSITKGIHREFNALSKIWYGFTGQTNNGWFVVSGSHKAEHAAQKHAARLKDQGYTAKVFPPLKNNNHHSVMIGSWLTLEDAKALKSRAIKDGLSKDTYLWKFKP